MNTGFLKSYTVGTDGEKYVRASEARGVISGLTAEIESQKKEHAASLHDAQSKHTAAEASGIAKGRTMERDRIRQIMKLPEFEGRERDALDLMLSNDINAQSVAKLLHHVPKRKTGGDQFSEYMAKLGNPDIGADYDADDFQETNVMASIARGDL